MYRLIRVLFILFVFGQFDGYSQEISYPIELIDHLECQDNTFVEYKICLWTEDLSDEEYRIDPELQFDSGIMFNRIASKLYLPFRILSVDLKKLRYPINFDVDEICSDKIKPAIKLAVPESAFVNYDINILVSNGNGKYKTSTYLGDSLIYVHLLEIGPFRTLMHEFSHVFEKNNATDNKHVNDTVLPLFEFWDGEIENNLMAQPNSEVFDFLFTRQQKNSMLSQTLGPLDKDHTLPEDLAPYLETILDKSIVEDGFYREFISSMNELEGTIIRSYTGICSFTDIKDYLKELKRVQDLLNSKRDEIKKLYYIEAEYAIKGTNMSAEIYVQMKMERFEGKLQQYRNIADAYYYCINITIPKDLNKVTLEKLLIDYNVKNKTAIPFYDFYLGAKMTVP